MNGPNSRIALMWSRNCDGTQTIPKVATRRPKDKTLQKIVEEIASLNLA